MHHQLEQAGVTLPNLHGLHTVVTEAKCTCKDPIVNVIHTDMG
jgi:hypothetical protein